MALDEPCIGMKIFGYDTINNWLRHNFERSVLKTKKNKNKACSTPRKWKKETSCMQEMPMVKGWQLTMQCSLRNIVLFIGNNYIFVIGICFVWRPLDILPVGIKSKVRVRCACIDLFVCNTVIGNIVSWNMRHPQIFNGRHVILYYVYTMMFCSLRKDFQLCKPLSWNREVWEGSEGHLLGYQCPQCSTMLHLHGLPVPSMQDNASPSRLPVPSLQHKCFTFRDTSALNAV